MVTDWDALSFDLEKVPLGTKDEREAAYRALFDAHKAGRADITDKALRTAHNATLHTRIGEAIAREQRRRKAAGVQQKKTVVRQKIKADRKAKDEQRAVEISEAILAQLEAAGVDLSPLRNQMPMEAVSE